MAAAAQFDEELALIAYADQGSFAGVTSTTPAYLDDGTWHALLNPTPELCTLSGNSEITFNKAAIVEIEVVIDAEGGGTLWLDYDSWLENGGVDQNEPHYIDFSTQITLVVPPPA